MRAEIITSGTELLLGDILDTNAAYLSGLLRDLGIDIHFRTTVGDNEERMASALRIALGRADLIITTGGLGPTVDDVTREAVASATGHLLRLHPELVEAIETRFKSLGSKMTANNLQQAYIPEGATVIPNPVGTAPCFVVETPVGAIISLPGVPRELEYLMTHSVIPYLRDRFGLSEIIKTRILKTAAIGESAVDELIGDLMKGSNPTVGLNAHAGQTDVRITAKASTQEEADRVIADMEAQLRERLGDNTYGVGTQTLEEVVLGMLAERDETLAVVETVTLGLLTQRIASAPGRRAFRGGLVVTRREDLAECMSGLEPPPEDWVTCPEALDIADHLRKQTGATYALAVLGDTPAEGNTPRTAIALSGPQGSVQCDVLQRSTRDAYGRTWLSTMALNMLRKQILNH